MQNHIFFGDEIHCSAFYAETVIH